MNPFPDMPNVTDIGDGLRMVRTRDQGLTYRIIEPNGKASVIISVNSPPPATVPQVETPFEVRCLNGSHEVIAPDRSVFATTTDSANAALICKMLNLYQKVQLKKSWTRS